MVSKILVHTVAHCDCDCKIIVQVNSMHAVIVTVKSCACEGNRQNQNSLLENWDVECILIYLHVFSSALLCAFNKDKQITVCIVKLFELRLIDMKDMGISERTELWSLLTCT